MAADELEEDSPDMLMVYLSGARVNLGHFEVAVVIDYNGYTWTFWLS